MIWRIFIQIILGIKSFHDKDLIIKNLCSENIFIDNEKCIKVGGYGITFDFADKENLNLLELYSSPEVLKGADYSKKNDIWALGCILYELYFKEKPFKTIKDILNYYYEVPNKCDNDLKYLLSKMLCPEKKRISIKELLIDMRFKQKLLEVNLFDEIAEEKIKGK